MPKTTLRLNKKCALSNYSERHKYETFDISIEVELTDFTDQSVTETFTDIRKRLLEQEHDSILFFLENQHQDIIDKNRAEGENENGELII